MQLLLKIGGVLSFLMGMAIFSSAKGAIHEIEGFLLFLISAVLISGGAIVAAIDGSKASSVKASSASTKD